MMTSPAIPPVLPATSPQGTTYCGPRTSVYLVLPQLVREQDQTSGMESDIAHRTAGVSMCTSLNRPALVPCGSRCALARPEAAEC